MTQTPGVDVPNAEDVERLSETFDHLDSELNYDVLQQVYSRLHAGCPVPKTPAHGGYALVTRYDDIVEVEKNTKTFSSGRDGVLHPPHEGRSRSIPIEFDGPEHLAYRKLFMEALSAPRVRKLRPYLEDLTERMLDRFADGDDVDFVQNVAVQIPVRAVGHLLGLGEDANEEMQSFATMVLENAGTPKMVEGLQQLDALSAVHCNQRRERPGTDYLSTLVHLDFGGRPLTDDELMNIIRSFVFAGFETTARAIGSLVHHLVTHAEIQADLRSGSLPLEGVVEEGLRLFPPVQNMFRTATAATTLNGSELTEGERLVLLYAVANRDPAQFEDPESFCPVRANPRQHVAFGIGAHYCAGATLARAEIHVLLQALVKRPPLELAGTPRHSPHLMMGQMMGVDYLPLRFQEVK
ncbi:cytochrome P450 [Mycolicibacterium stellerae]|uniref:cytochrome P450 n=1 Tax=Mycolicibacterium stellerae TaxID=2358193 RepID=UPI000F0B1880|nr:cytochrome P450 [Mycolicibacterium stellerae]